MSYIIKLRACLLSVSLWVKKIKNQNIDPMKTIKSHIHTIFFSQFFTIPIIHSSNHTLFQSYILPIIHSFNPTLFQSYTTLFQSYLHSFNPILILPILQSVTIPWVQRQWWWQPEVRSQTAAGKFNFDLLDKTSGANFYQLCHFKTICWQWMLSINTNVA